MMDLNPINSVPSSAKIKSKQRPNNPISKPKSQNKRKTCKDKLNEENNNKYTKKTISLNHYYDSPKESTNPINYKLNSNHTKRKTFNVNNQKEKNLIRDYYDNLNLLSDKKENKKNAFMKDINEKMFNHNNNSKLMNSEYDEEQKKDPKDKIKSYVTVKNKNEFWTFINNNSKDNIGINNQNNFLAYKNCNNFRKTKKIQGNISSDIDYNNTFYNINPNNNRTRNISIYPNESSKVNECSSNIQTTSKLDAKTKNIYNKEFIKNNSENKPEKIDSKYLRNTDINFYIKKKINNLNYIYTKPKKNNYLNFKSADNKIYNNHKKSKQNNNNLYTNKNINISKIQFSENNSDSNQIAKIKSDNQNGNSFSIRLKKKINLDVINNNNETEKKLLSPKLTKYKLFNEPSDNINKLNNQPNIFINNNKNIVIQNYNNISNYLNNNLSKYPKAKNYSYDLYKKYQNNPIKNLKNMPSSRKYGKNLNEKINTFSIKDILYENKKTSDNKDNDKNEIININSDSTVEKNKENEETLYEETIIYNDNEVYSMTIKNSINSEINKKENKNLENKNNIIKEENKDDNKNKDNNQNDTTSISNNNNNFRETITIKYAENPNDNENNIQHKRPISELINVQNLISNKKKSKNNLYFKNYFMITNPGKNYGTRKTNQDTPVAFVSLNGIKGFNIFGVLDGHGAYGHYVSKFLSGYLIKQIINHKEIEKVRDLNQIYQILRKSNYEILTNIFDHSDKILGKQDFDVNFSGTTCVLVIQIGENLICTNVGDSRAILIYDKFKEKDLSKAEIFELSHDCKPDLPEEKKRIIKMGGTVDQMLDINGFRGGPQRVWAKNKNFPGLAMSRSFGDYKGKQCGIIPLPEIIEYKLDEKSKYMVICSDGVWEFLSNKNVMEIGNEFYLRNDIKGFTEKLIKKSEVLWEKQDVIVDDITAVVVYF